MTVDANDLPAPEDLHFGHFAAVPEYREVNRQLVQELFRHMPNPFVHVDLATGTGLVPQLLIEEAEKRGFQGTIIGIDRSAKALEIAEATTPRPAGIELRFVEADARYLERLRGDELPADGADSLSIHDAIHEITDEDGQRRVYQGMSAIAREGALLSSNSTFTTVSMAVAELAAGTRRVEAALHAADGRPSEGQGRLAALSPSRGLPEDDRGRGVQGRA